MANGDTTSSERHGWIQSEDLAEKEKAAFNSLGNAVIATDLELKSYVIRDQDIVILYVTDEALSQWKKEFNENLP